MVSESSFAISFWKAAGINAIMAQIQILGCDVAFVEGIFLEFSDATGRFLGIFL